MKQDFKISNNFLNEIPSFDVYWSGILSSKNNAFYFNFNKIERIVKMSAYLEALSYLNFDFNNISSIEIDAFIILKSLQTLSISNNFLKNIPKSFKCLVL